MYKVLLVEDTDSDIDAFENTLSRMNEEQEHQFESIIVKNYDEAITKLSSDVDCAIIDIKLPGDKSGNDVIKAIFDRYRIPIAVMSGTPEVEDDLVKIYSKGESSYEDIILGLEEELKTGLFNIVGGKGVIEENINRIFRDNLYKNIGVWKELSKKDHAQTEKVILRYTIAHLQELLDQEIDLYEPIEMYIQPIISQELKTGTIVENMANKKKYILISPPCDLAIRQGGTPNVDTVILAEIEDFKTYYNPGNNVTSVSDTQITKIKSLINNNSKNYLYWLSDHTSIFEGGIVNFLKIISVEYSDVSNTEKYSKVIKLQDSFVKSILSKFSTYYNRQGQPDFNFDELARSIAEKIIQGRQKDAEHS